MRELTFLGFLRGYVQQLSRQNTLSLRKLVQEASTDNFRLREPLFLYALESGKTELLLQACTGTVLESPFQALVAAYDAASMRTALTNCSPDLDDRYHKVWRSYQSLRQRSQSDAHTKELLRAKILRLQKEKQVTNYRLYKDLGLNPGNANAWLKHGQSQKISLENARQMLQYLQ